MCSQLVTTFIVISIVIRLHIAQRHSAVGCRRDIKRYLLFLCRRIGCTCVGRDILFIDVDTTSDKPIVGWRCHIMIVIDTAIGITVVYNLLGIMHKVTRSLNVFRPCCCISKLAIGFGFGIVAKERHLIHVIYLTTFTMFILRIYIATTHTWHHVDQIELYNTCDMAPYVLTCRFSFLFLQLQIHT